MIYHCAFNFHSLNGSWYTTAFHVFYLPPVHYLWQNVSSFLFAYFLITLLVFHCDPFWISFCVSFETGFPSFLILFLATFSFRVWMSNYSITWLKSPPPLNCFFHLCEKLVGLYLYGCDFGSFILFHWSVYFISSILPESLDSYSYIMSWNQINELLLLLISFLRTFYFTCFSSLAFPYILL